MKSKSSYKEFYNNTNKEGKLLGVLKALYIKEFVWN